MFYLYRVMANAPSSPCPSSTNKDAAGVGVTDPTPSNTNVDIIVGSCGMPNATEDDGTTLTLGKKKNLFLIFGSIIILIFEMVRKPFANIVRKHLEVLLEMVLSI